MEMGVLGTLLVQAEVSAAIVENSSESPSHPTTQHGVYTQRKLNYHQGERLPPVSIVALLTVRQIR